MSDNDTSLSGVLDPQRARLLYHTVRNMRARQLGGVAERKLRHLVVPSLPVDFDGRYEPSSGSVRTAVTEPVAATTASVRAQLPTEVVRSLGARARELRAGEVTFRNRTVSVDGPDGVDWFGPGVPPPPTLWGILFHGFEFLSWPVLAHGGPGECPAVARTAARWIRDWDAAEVTRVGARNYLRRCWTPHAVSLRTLNLIRYYAWAGGDHDACPAATVRRLVAKNAAFLSNHVEHDVGGNHLIENGAALTMAGTFLPGAGARWRRQGMDVLVDAADQFLTDGGHFERSPMYHVATLSRYLTAIDLLERAGHDVPARMRRVAVAGTRFLAAIAPPDGRLPLLNDSAFGFSLPLESCLGYARAVGIDPDAGAAPDDGSPPAPTASGYHWLGEGADRLLVDGTAIGPPHLPAHSHNDQFAVLWWVGGRRVLTDTGVFEYLPTGEREYARSVAAHNTVQYADAEPIPTGGSYLFGRRIDPVARTGTRDGVRYFDGQYRRTARSGPSYRHRRRIYAADGWWLVWDRLATDEPAPVRSRLHFDPAVELRSERVDGRRRLAILARPADPPPDGDSSRTGAAPAGATPSDPLAYAYPIDVARVTREASPYFPEFGRRVSRPSVTLRRDGADVSFGVLLSTARFDAVEVDRDGDAVTGLRTDDTYRSLPDTAG
jgi:hypothetical protein